MAADGVDTSAPGGVCCGVALLVNADPTPDQHVPAATASERREGIRCHRSAPPCAKMGTANWDVATGKRPTASYRLRRGRGFTQLWLTMNRDTTRDIANPRMIAKTLLPASHSVSFSL